MRGVPEYRGTIQEEDSSEVLKVVKIIMYSDTVNIPVYNFVSKYMESLELEFFYQTEVRKEWNVNIPVEVFNFIKEESSEESVEYRWNYDKRNETLLISTEGTRHEKISKLETTIDHQAGGRTSIPEDVRDKVDIKIGDNLYLWTHNRMAEAGAPSVIVWEFDQMEELIFKKMASMSKSELFPNF